METELLYAKVDQLEAGGPFLHARPAALSVCARRQAITSRAPCRRRGPVGAAPDDVLAGHIRRLLEASPFHGDGYRKAWSKLRVAGIRTSLERVRRFMREHNLQAPHLAWAIRTARRRTTARSARRRSTR